MVSFPYHSHIFRDSYGSGMGIVWEASHKGVPLLGVPGITLEFTFQAMSPNMYPSVFPKDFRLELTYPLLPKPCLKMMIFQVSRSVGYVIVPWRVFKQFDTSQVVF